MTTQKRFKRRVRERMAKTGERYTAARRQVAARQDGLAGDSSPAFGQAPSPAIEPATLASALELASDERITEATGRGWLSWIAVLDAWGAGQRRHGETATYLIAEHGVPGWWAQSITNGYERVRGLRQKHQQADGFTIYASKTIGVPVEVLFDGFSDEALRDRWLTDASMSPRSSQAGRVARFDWGDGRTRVTVTFEAKGEAKSTAFVAHERLADAEAAEAAKAAWRSRLAALKSLLEGPA